MLTSRFMASPADAFDRRNLLTYVSLLCGVAAIAGANGGKAPVAGFLIAAAVIADTFDGRFARRFGNDPRRRALGVELDSLADAIAFGIAPPLCAALLLHGEMDARGAALWGAAFVHAACAVTRLAAYNVDATEPARRDSSASRFRAALIWPRPCSTTQPCNHRIDSGHMAAMVLPLNPEPTGAGLVALRSGPWLSPWSFALAIRH